MRAYSDYLPIIHHDNNDIVDLIDALQLIETLCAHNLHNINNFNVAIEITDYECGLLSKNLIMINPFLRAHYGFYYDVVIKHGIMADNYYVSFVPNKEQ